MEAIYGEMEVESCYTLLELPTAKKKRRSKDGAGNSDKPKKPRSAYLLYYFDVRQNMQQENPELPQSEINKCISDSWKRLNVADRGYYLERARMERDGVDPSSQSAASSPDVPGFRKILPRANYVLLPKSSVGGERGLVEVSVDGDVELSEQRLAIEGLCENTAASAPLRGVLSHNSRAIQKASGLGRDALRPSAGAVHLKGEESRVVGGACDDIGIVTDNGMESPIRTDGTHLVAVIPHQGVVENKVVSTAGPVMMFPLVKSVKAEPKPAFKLPIRYTRRGRGNCNTPGCVFSYVTRHKPLQCPDCGQHLGGKWVTPPKRPTSTNPRDDSKLLTAHSAHVTEDAKVTRSADATDRPDSSVSSQKPSEDEAQVRSGSGAGRRRREKTVHGPAVLSLSEGPIQVQLKEKGSSGAQKRRIRAILPAPAQSNTAVQSAVVQWISVGPDEVKTDAVKASSEHIVGLKPSTLKQLGHIIPERKAPSTVSSNQYIITDNGVKILSMLPIKKTSGSSLDLGLSTARGRGHCKNPACDYVYKNRHKPQHCPTCGWELGNKFAKKTRPTASDEVGVDSEVLIDPSQSLTAAQKELQRQSTVSLLRCCLQFPESETEVQDIFNLIQQLNASRESKKRDSGWPTFYEPAATSCTLCHYPLLKGEHSSAAGLEECWLLTDGAVQLVTLQVKICSNLQCLALHSFTDLHPGLFNVGNQLLVTLDLFFKMRHQIRRGDNPADAALSIIRNSQTEGVLGYEHMSRVQELFCSGYWAFECLTVRDYNDMICGVCGIAPKLEVAQRNTNNVLLLKNVEFTWPDVQVTDEVQVDEFWLTMEHEALEQAAFPCSLPITRFDASIIAPFIPPLMRSATVINTEKDKICSDSLAGDPAVLVRLIHDGLLRSDQMEQHSEQELRDLLEKCGCPAAVDASKEQLLASVSLLHSQIQNGLWTGPEPEAHVTAGRISRVCPHQVVCSSKYVVRRETARDHVDLLVSTRFWPPVYVTDCAQKVALCADVVYPELTSQMWGRNQGCFSDPSSAPQFVSCSELQDQLYSLDLSVIESNPQLHPLTKSTSRWIVRPDSSPDAHHAMTLCKELEPYVDVVGEMCHESEKEASEYDSAFVVASVRRKALVFENAAYYYLYNRLVDFLSSRDIVNQQIAEVLSTCQPGEVVMIRDALYRLGVAQLNSEEQDAEDGGMVEEEIMLL
ncbi:HMG domain-containing protein 3 HMG box-containing protein 3 [Triplophysa tibetana]|uniref:HMG domain-containing protein 3 HMG box-containing protein 3 n=1 Tax=Triplophysa tibetana TaxID=1572043 RepID=A0A5A9NLV2_9TELE|nr:HMG domain-containing protein 3 HMG box-containing protein 3 [Triplophysa tibetana]